MASSGKPTAVHFTLIFFVMLSLILGAVSYNFFSQYKKTVAEHKKADEDLAKNKDAVMEQVQQLRELKNKIGFGEGFEIGRDDDADNPNTVLGAMTQDIAKFGSPDQGQRTYRATLLDLSERWNKRMRAEAEKQQTIVQKDDDFQKLETRDQQTIASHKKRADDTESEMRKVQEDAAESLAAKDQQIGTLRTNLNDTRTELAEEKEAHERDVVALRDDVGKLTIANERLVTKLEEATKQSFEIADGNVRTVDHSSGLVWISLGEIDKIKPRTTFSVYTKDHQGVGRDPEDIKGAIEVTRVVGPHLSQARIIDDDIYRPVTKGDPIYSPLWSPGRTERFAFIGALDIDGDGRSDRAMLRDLVATSGATIDNEVDDVGNRTGDGLTVHTKFLVVGELPDPASTSKQEERDKMTQVLKHFSDMEKEARFHGVRKVRLNDFLDYLGYRPQRRLWQPGQAFPFRLKAGAHSTATNQTVGDRASSGQVSKRFGRSKRLPQAKSSGQTSGAFRGNK